MLVDDGALSLTEPAAVPEWSDPDDPRHAITLWDLMRMQAGLEWQEDYVGDGSDVIEMLFSRQWEPVADTGGFAASKPLAVAPGTRLNYSSGTTNIVSRLVADTVGRGPDYGSWLRRRLFDPVGMESATPVFDEVGTWIASSYCWCTARDFVRFGQLYLDDGCVDGGTTRILDGDWVATARTPTGREPPAEGGGVHTAHWWAFDDRVPEAFMCSGYEGQYIVVVPSADAVVVRLGKSDASIRDNVRSALCEVIEGLGG